jgi:quinol monooxygenase YgiN
MKSIQPFLLSALLSLCVASEASSQNAASAPPQSAIYVVTYIDVSLASVPRAIGLLQQYHDKLAQSGNANVDLCEELGRPDHFAIVETWPDRASFDAHKSGPEATQLLAGLKDMQSAPPDSRILQGFAVGPARPPGGGRAKVYMISRFEIPAARLADFGAMTKPYVAASRTDQGGMRFDILQELNPRQNQLTIYESWSNPQDFETHRISAPVQKFRDGLAPMLIGSYDDRLYGKFN